ncbi:hypothetical protein ACGFNP_26380 [Nonomuraea sp. NPDC049269]|uniref:hypothetical protein n=1 Tax=Nonomuraea sp. NPDC049269 TaxID=3364349 RepID=UPI003721D7D7
MNFEIIESLGGETAIGRGVDPLGDGFEPETQALAFPALLDVGPFRYRPISRIRSGPGVDVDLVPEGHRAWPVTGPLCLVQARGTVTEINYRYRSPWDPPQATPVENRTIDVMGGAGHEAP